MKRKLFRIFLVIFLLIAARIAWAGFQGGNFGIPTLIQEIAGEEVTKDQLGHTNILLVGVGGEGHEGEQLSDTMILASIDHESKQVAMLSIPRDLYVENEAVGWGSRLNSVNQVVYDNTESEEAAIAALESQIQEILNVPIHYYVKVDFGGFEDIVDALGGVDVNVKNTINDPTYPAPKDGNVLHDPFYLAAGEQTLDGATALKYARSRHGSSDFSRAERQQELLVAMKDKALSLGSLKPSRVENLITAIQDNFMTDLSIPEMIYLGIEAADYERENVAMAVFNDAPYLLGGMLYTPDKELYNEMLILTPYTGDFSETALFAKIFLYHPEIIENGVKIEVLNATTAPGLAGLTKMHLQRHGFDVSLFGNAATIGQSPRTQIYWRPIQTTVPYEPERDPEETAQLLEQAEAEQIQKLEASTRALEEILPAQYNSLLPTEYAKENWESEADIILILGDDFVEYYQENTSLFYEGFY